MKNNFFSATLFCALLTTSFFVHSQETTQWKPLFFEDLSNADYPEGVWSFDGGILTAAEDNCIWTQKEYENFTLDLEFKNMDASNSGVLVYCIDTENWIPNALEISIIDDYSEKWKDSNPTWLCGAVFGLLAPDEQRVKKPGKWNKMRITCQGEYITVALNGKLITHMDKSLWTDDTLNPNGTKIPAWMSPRVFADLPTKGKIGFQGQHGGVPIWFRKIKVKQLN